MKMCKCCQHCMESCYWHLIEKRFCFDKNIALYEEPVKRTNEKNNNMFDNMAFFDSVSVIAGRAIVTIDPLPPKDKDPIIEQPKKRLKWPNQNSRDLGQDYLKPIEFLSDHKANDLSSSDTGNESDTFQENALIRKGQKTTDGKFIIKKSVSFHNIPDKTSLSSEESEEKSKSSTENLTIPEDDLSHRKKSLRERRMSKSLYLKIDLPREIPIIRQSSMPKFYMGIPEENQVLDSSLVRTPSTVLRSPITSSSDFNFDLYSVVQIEKSRSQSVNKTPPALVHKESSRLNLIKEKIMLKKSKSTVSASNLPYTNHM